MGLAAPWRPCAASPWPWGRPCGGLFALLGAVPGIIMTGLTLAAGAWLTSIDGATEALDKHQASSTRLWRPTRAKDKTGDWAKAIKGASSSRSRPRSERTIRSFNKVRGGLVAPQDYFGNDKLGTTEEGRRSNRGIQVGSISAVKFKETINGLAEADPKLDKNLVKGLLEAADKRHRARKLDCEAERRPGGDERHGDRSSTAPPRHVRRHGRGGGEDPKLTFSTQAYGDALDVLKGKIPTLAAELKELKDLAEIDHAA